MTRHDGMSPVAVTKGSCNGSSASSRTATPGHFDWKGYDQEKIPLQLSIAQCNIVPVVAPQYAVVKPSYLQANQNIKHYLLSTRNRSKCGNGKSLEPSSRNALVPHAGDIGKAKTLVLVDKKEGEQEGEESESKTAGTLALLPVSDRDFGKVGPAKLQLCIPRKEFLVDMEAIAREKLSQLQEEDGVSGFQKGMGEEEVIGEIMQEAGMSTGVSYEWMNEDEIFGRRRKVGSRNKKEKEKSSSAEEHKLPLALKSSSLPPLPTASYSSISDGQGAFLPTTLPNVNSVFDVNKNLFSNITEPPIFTTKGDEIIILPPSPSQSPGAQSVTSTSCGESRIGSPACCVEDSAHTPSFFASSRGHAKGQSRGSEKKLASRNEREIQKTYFHPAALSPLSDITECHGAQNYKVSPRSKGSVSFDIPAKAEVCAIGRKPCLKSATSANSLGGVKSKDLSFGHQSTRNPVPSGDRASQALPFDNDFFSEKVHYEKQRRSKETITKTDQAPQKPSVRFNPPRISTRKSGVGFSDDTTSRSRGVFLTSEDLGPDSDNEGYEYQQFNQIAEWQKSFIHSESPYPRAGMSFSFPGSGINTTGILKVKTPTSKRTARKSAHFSIQKSGDHGCDEDSYRTIQRRESLEKQYNIFGNEGCKEPIYSFPLNDAVDQSNAHAYGHSSYIDPFDVHVIRKQTGNSVQYAGKTPTHPRPASNEYTFCIPPSLSECQEEDKHDKCDDVDSTRNSKATGADEEDLWAKDIFLRRKFLDRISELHDLSNATIHRELWEKRGMIQKSSGDTPNNECESTCHSAQVTSTQRSKSTTAAANSVRAKSKSRQSTGTPKTEVVNTKN
eukprot:Nk52_evm11s150 gene=Nk52_evmTU11s150